MSIACRLEGTVSSETPLGWSGVWQFVKEKKTALNFRFKQTTNVIDRELFDYVSFANEPTLQPALKKSASKKLKYKHVKSAVGQPIVDPIEHMAQEPHEQQADGVSGDQIGQDPLNTSAETEKEKEEARPGVEIKQTHPLLGVWEGSFDIKTVKGEEGVADTFFFHTLLGALPENADEFKELPPEPQFPYSLLKRHDAPTATGQSPATDPNTVNSNNSNTNFDNTKTEATTNSNNNTMDVSNTPDKQQQENDETLTHEAIDINNNSNNNNTNVASKQLHSNNNVVILVGFGRNIYGRFSVAAMYDDTTKELRCEKKYLVSKFSAKRGRKSFAECAASAALLDASGGEITGELNYKSIYEAEAVYRQHQILQQQQAHQQQISTLTTRHRGISASYNFDLDMANNNSSSINNNAVSELSSKRKRSMSSYRSYEDLYYEEDYSNYNRSVSTSTKNNSLSKDQHHYHYNSNNNHYNNNNVIIQNFNHPIPNASNILTGSRNPDNDDPQLEYREAFQDCDSGEVYEGEWNVHHNIRHGFGICIYTDGLMYEGNWVLGKEHGKGKLMTGDRQVIYSGDWLDGYLHGFGTYYFENGDRYAGDWRESCRQGRGDYAFKNGCRYTGDFKDNKRHGKGLFIWPDGDSYYDGEWEQNMRHGRGILVLSNGFKYDGTWVNNLMEGKGTCTFPSGQIYQGTFKGGLREGRGSVQFAEGAIYEGRFKEDRFDGQGTIKITDNVPGIEEGEIMIPIHIQADLWRIHLKAGFGHDTGH